MKVDFGCPFNRRQIEDQVNAIHVAIIRRLVNLIIIEPLQFAGAHRRFLIVRAHPGSRQFEHQMIAVARPIIFAAISVRV